MQKEQILSLDKFVANADNLLEELSVKHSRFILTKNGNAVAVVQDMNEYQKLLDALNMLKLIVQGEKDIQSGKIKQQKDVFKNLNQLLESKIAGTV